MSAVTDRRRHVPGITVQLTEWEHVLITVALTLRTEMLAELSESGWCAAQREQTQALAGRLREGFLSFTEYDRIVDVPLPGIVDVPAGGGSS